MVVGTPLEQCRFTCPPVLYMKREPSLCRFLRTFLVLYLFFSCPLIGNAQGPFPAEAKSTVEMSPFIAIAPNMNARHKFWDKENTALFSVTAALSSADFAVTRANLQNGGLELNPITRVFGRTTAGLAVNFSGQTAGVIGISYLFHRTGHHKLERIACYINIGGSSSALLYSLKHR